LRTGEAGAIAVWAGICEKKVNLPQIRCKYFDGAKTEEQRKGSPSGEP
jgi:hypothetical protein